MENFARKWRRARNLRGGSAPPRVLPAPPQLGLAAAAVLATLAGAALIAVHARMLARPGEQAAATGIDALQPALPGAVFTVPEHPGMSLTPVDGGAVAIAVGMVAAAPLRVDLCSQVQAGTQGRLLPLRIGYHFDDVARWVAQNQASGAQVTLRNVGLLSPAASAMPRVQVSGSAAPGFAGADGPPLHLSWEGVPARWLSDTSQGRIDAGGKGTFLRDGWLAWGESAALRIQRRRSAACDAGELLLQLYRAGGPPAARAMVSAFPLRGQPMTAWLAAGRYQVPPAARARLEDQLLFEQLQAYSLLRLSAAGQIELAPRDLLAWQSADGAMRSAPLPGWEQLVLDEPARKLIKRLYHAADGQFLRQQVDIFNGERRLLAWRMRPDLGPGDWRASVGGAGVPTVDAMPAAAARLFAELPQGWGPWSRIGGWPAGASGAATELTFALPAPAGVRSVQMMLAGRVLAVRGASLRGSPEEACSGRACPARDAVQMLTLDLAPGARSFTITARPLDMAALARPGDQQYRHLQLVSGRLAWRPVGGRPNAGPKAVQARLTLADRNGVLLWSGGSPSAAASEAGLASMLGVRAEHAASIAGMLARIPSASGEPHAARLTLDLALQRASQRALECIGMQHGRLDGKRCVGAQGAPSARQAGLVVLDTDTGDVLAAAGAGNPAVNAANWAEARDFDRSNPARSPLRLPALQHDGGAHRSPGSTFKVVSALGLEQAAKGDPDIEALLSGMTLPALNRMASLKGFAFQTAAARYPLGTQLAHITNYKDQHLDRRAQDGRLGLSQALTYSLNTWFAWTGELSDRSLFGRADGGAADLQALEPGALDGIRPIVGMARKLGFEQPQRLDGGLLPADFAWGEWDALQGSAARIDPIHSRHELRQMAIGLRMQVTPLQMAMVAGAVGQGRTVVPRLLLELDGRQAAAPTGQELGVRLDRIRAGMKGVVDGGTAAGAFRGHAALRRGLSGKTGTAPSVGVGPHGGPLSTVWFSGWLEPGSLPNQQHRLAVAVFISHSDSSGGEHAAPVAAAVLEALSKGVFP